MDANADGTSNSTQPGSTPREGRPPQGIADPQLQLSAVSQQQEESTELTGVLRERPIPGPSDGVGGGVPPISEYGRPPPLEQPYNTLPNYSQPPLPLHDPVTFAGPNAPPPRQYPGYGGPVPGYPGYQQFTPFQGQGQLPGQPPFYRWDQSGQLMNPPPPQFPFPFPPPPHPAPFFDQLHNRIEPTAGFAHRNSVPASAGRDMGPGACQIFPGWPYPVALQPPMHLPAGPQVYPQMPFQTNSQMPPQMNPWIPPHEMQIRGPMPMNWGAPPGPPPPHPGPSLVPGGPMPVTNRAGPSTGRHPTSRTSRTSAAPQPRSLRSDPDDGPENDGTGSDVRRGATGSSRKARQTKRNKQD